MTPVATIRAAPAVPSLAGPPAAPWVDVCRFDDLVPDRGVCALVGYEQVAVFRTSPYDELFALSNLDPFSRANVLSRGLVGSKGNAPKLVSPVYKQSFDLRTGRCFEDAGVSLATYATRVVEGMVQVFRSPRPFPGPEGADPEAGGPTPES